MGGEEGGEDIEFWSWSSLESDLDSKYEAAKSKAKEWESEAESKYDSLKSEASKKYDSLKSEAESKYDNLKDKKVAKEKKAKKVVKMLNSSAGPPSRRELPPSSIPSLRKPPIITTASKARLTATRSLDKKRRITERKYL